jgi:3-keto-5-aminohexanoate cleavage enzyme
MRERGVLICVAPNGGRRTKADHPALPMTATELAATAAACADAGAGMIHLHVRNTDGHHVLDAALFREAISAIRAEVGERLIVQITTEALGRHSREEQMALVRDVRPEAVSIGFRELCPDSDAEPDFARFGAWIVREQIAAQHILYDAAEVPRFLDLLDRGVVPGEPAPAVLYVLGRYGGANAAPSDLQPFLDAAGARLPNFMACGFGPAEIDCLTAAAVAGGDVRVGFENNLRLPGGDIAKDNAALVRACVEALARVGLAPAAHERG